MGSAAGPGHRGRRGLRRGGTLLAGVGPEGWAPLEGMAVPGPGSTPQSAAVPGWGEVVPERTGYFLVVSGQCSRKC